MKPIVFSTDMVKAILAGNKTQTRRVIKPQPVYDNGWYSWKNNLYDKTFFGNDNWIENNCPYQKSQVLWVRETWQLRNKTFLYKADYGQTEAKYLGCWRPSIYLPRQAARIFLEVLRINVEKLQDISEEDAEKEGIEIVDINCYRNYLVNNNWFYNGKNQKQYHALQDPKMSFASLWDSINYKRSFGWHTNPWVWVIEFERSKP